MDLLEFCDAVSKDARLKGIAVEEEQKARLDYVIVQDIQTGIRTKLLIPTVLHHEWETLRGLIVGDIDSQPVHHVTRITGYFSNVDNWNPSKVAELRDRRKAEAHLKIDEKLRDW